MRARVSFFILKRRLTWETRAREVPFDFPSHVLGEPESAAGEGPSIFVTQHGGPAVPMGPPPPRSSHSAGSSAGQPVLTPNGYLDSSPSSPFFPQAISRRTSSNASIDPTAYTMLADFSLNGPPSPATSFPGTAAEVGFSSVEAHYSPETIHHPTFTLSSTTRFGANPPMLQGGSGGDPTSSAAYAQAIVTPLPPSPAHGITPHDAAMIGLGVDYSDTAHAPGIFAGSPDPLSSSSSSLFCACSYLLHNAPHTSWRTRHQS